MIKTLIGDMFKSKMETLVNTVNCVGVMGKGVALLFKKQFPAMFEEYHLFCEQGKVKLGSPYYYSDFGGASVVNFPTKDHWRSATRLVDVENGLDFFIANYKDWEIKSIAFPPLGCGNGGLDWKDVGPLMWSKLSKIDIPVEIYAPFGTPNNELTTEFLSADQQIEFDTKGKRPDKLRPEWAALVEILYQLEHQPYANPVGRTIFQKICYVFTKQKVDTGFKFERNSYGPYASEVKNAINVLANQNWILEEQKGQMNALKIGLRYKSDRSKLSAEIKPYHKKIKKTVDLFSRIKNTEQAEEVATVIFSVQKLKSEKDPSKVTELDLFNYVLEWKKTWKNDVSKQKSVGDTIRNMQMLDWIKLQFSEELSTS